MFRSILIVDDEASMRQVLSLILANQGYVVRSVSNGDEAMKELAARHYDAVVCDVRLPALDGMSVLNQAIERWPNLTFLMMSAYGDAETPLEVLEAGASDYVQKPCRPEEILLALRKAEKRLERMRCIPVKPKPKTPWDRWLGHNKAIIQLKDSIERIAASPATVLLQGESGTGKELVARALHACSDRQNCPFIAVNCGAWSAGLVESELFGHVRGAFTGAYCSKQGLFAAAHGGTLLLDEVAEIPLALQAKLLRVLQEGEFRPIGSTQLENVDVRIIAATNRNLEACVAQGIFREDLYFRLNVISLWIPPLRERRDDILSMAWGFADKYARSFKKGCNGFSEKVEQFLLDYHWPGNVRELENAMECAMLLSTQGKIDWEHLPEHLRNKNQCLQEPLNKSLEIPSAKEHNYSLKNAICQIEKTYILAALERTEGNRTRAAELLKISNRALLDKIKDYGIDLKSKFKKGK